MMSIHALHLIIEMINNGTPLPSDILPQDKTHAVLSLMLGEAHLADDDQRFLYVGCGTEDVLNAKTTFYYMCLGAGLKASIVTEGVVIYKKNTEIGKRFTFTPIYNITDINPLPLARAFIDANDVLFEQYYRALQQAILPRLADGNDWISP